MGDVEGRHIPGVGMCSLRKVPYLATPTSPEKITAPTLLSHHAATCSVGSKLRGPLQPYHALSYPLALHMHYHFLLCSSTFLCLDPWFLFLFFVFKHLVWMSVLRPFPVLLDGCLLSWQCALTCIIILAKVQPHYLCLQLPREQNNVLFCDLLQILTEFWYLVGT